MTIAITLQRPCPAHACPSRWDCLLYLARPQADSLVRAPGPVHRSANQLPDVVYCCWCGREVHTKPPLAA